MSEKNGFSVVAPTSTSSPSSTNGSSTSCCAREKRCTSSRKRIVPWPRSPSRARARSATSRTSFTPALTALRVSNAFSLTPATSRAIVVLPGAGRTPDDDRRQPVRLDEHPQRLRPARAGAAGRRPRRASAAAAAPRAAPSAPAAPPPPTQTNQALDSPRPGYAPPHNSHPTVGERNPSLRADFPANTALSQRSRGAFDDLAIGRRVSEDERQPARCRQRREPLAVGDDGARAGMERKAVVLGEHLAIGPGEVGPEGLRIRPSRGTAGPAAAGRARRNTSSTCNSDRLPPGSKPIPRSASSDRTTRHVATRARLECAPSTSSAVAATRRRGAARRRGSSELVLAQERRAVAQRPLERGARECRLAA